MSKIKSTEPYTPVFLFNTYSGSITVQAQLERAMKMYNALVLSGMTGYEAKVLIECFHRDAYRDAYRDGYGDAEFDNCGEDA